MDQAKIILTKFARHILTHHSCEDDVEKIVEKYLPEVKKAILTGQLLSTKQVADYFPFLNEKMLLNYRARNGGPDYIKLGNFPRSRVCYRMADILRWIDNHRVRQSGPNVPPD